MKVLIAIFFMNAVSVAFGFDNETMEAIGDKDQCAELNQQRMDMQDCCDYPRIHFFKIFSQHCVDECVGTKDMCCSMTCVWRNTRVTFTEEGGVNLAGLKQTLLSSVVHKDEWFNLIHKAVDQCDSEGMNRRRHFSCLLTYFYIYIHSRPRCAKSLRKNVQNSNPFARTRELCHQETVFDVPEHAQFAEMRNNPQIRRRLLVNLISGEIKSLFVKKCVIDDKCSIERLSTLIGTFEKAF